MTSTGRRITRAAVLRLARRAIAYEWGMWRSLFRWILRRPAVPRGAKAYGYAGVVTPLICVFIALSAIEIPIVHLVLPWDTAERVSLALGAYGLFWMIGLLASIRVNPHVVDGSGLRVRYGPAIDIPVPWDAIAAIRSRRRSLASSRTIQVESGESGSILIVGVSGQTSVDVVLRRPTRLPLPRGGEEVTELRFYVDDPDAFAARAREHLAGEPGPARPQSRRP